MVTQITRDEVQRMLAEGARLVDVLPEAEYAEEHIRGAVNLPLRLLDGETVAGLERDEPLIVYCFDSD